MTTIFADYPSIPQIIYPANRVGGAFYQTWTSTDEDTEKYKLLTGRPVKR